MAVTQESFAARGSIPQASTNFKTSTKMRKIFIHLETGYCGSDGYDLIEVPEDWTDSHIDEEVYLYAVDNAATYGYEVCGDDCELDEEDDHEHYYEDMIGYSWEDYDPEQHDGYIR